jgi:hypothetical protein
VAFGQVMVFFCYLIGAAPSAVLYGRVAIKAFISRNTSASFDRKI